MTKFLIGVEIGLLDALLYNCIAIIVALHCNCNAFAVALQCNCCCIAMQLLLYVLPYVFRIVVREVAGGWMEKQAAMIDRVSTCPYPVLSFTLAHFQCNSLISAVCMFFNCITLPCATANCISKQSCNVLLPGNAILWIHIPFCTAVSTELCTTKLQCCALSHTVHRTGKAWLWTTLHWTATVPPTPTHSCNGEMAWRFPLKD